MPWHKRYNCSTPYCNKNANEGRVILRFDITWRSVMSLSSMIYHILLGALVVSVFFVLAIILAPSAEAAQTVPYKINFQGRLTSANGAVVADGSYNIRFRLYSAASGGSPVWTETRETTNRVQVQNGLFNLQLGDVTALSPSMFTNFPLYVEVELPTPVTATCSTVGCASWTEGAMTPRNPIGSAPQAMNADTIDGIDSDALAKLASGNTFTSTNLFKANAVNAFGIQNTNGDNLFAADTTNMKVSVGSATNNVELSLNGIKLSGNARSTKTVTLVPEYAGATFQGDGTNNNGSLSSDFCSSASALNINTDACAVDGLNFNYYKWTTTQATLQDYDIYVKYQLPSDYDTGSMTNLVLDAQSSTYGTGQKVDLSMYNEGGVLCSSIDGSFVDASSPEFTFATVANPLGTNCASTPANAFVIFKIKLSAINNESVRVADIKFTYRGKF